MPGTGTATSLCHSLAFSPRCMCMRAQSMYFQLRAAAAAVTIPNACANAIERGKINIWNDITSLFRNEIYYHRSAQCVVLLFSPFRNHHTESDQVFWEILLHACECVGKRHRCCCCLLLTFSFYIIIFLCTEASSCVVMNAFDELVEFSI